MKLEMYKGNKETEETAYIRLVDGADDGDPNVIYLALCDEEGELLTCGVLLDIHKDNLEFCRVERVNRYHGLELDDSGRLVIHDYPR